VSTIDVLMSNGVDPHAPVTVNHYCCKEMSGLSYAVWMNRADVVKALVSKHNVDANNDIFSAPALFMAVNTESLQLVDFLIDNGAQINGVLGSYIGTFYSACQVPIIQTSLSSIDGSKNSAASISIFKCLIELKADVNATSPVDDYNSLHTSATNEVSYPLPLGFQCQSIHQETTRVKILGLPKARYEINIP